MKKNRNALLALGLTAAAIPAVITAEEYRKNFKLRLNEPTGFKEYFLKKNPDMKTEPFSCTSNRLETLRGLIFWPQNEPKALIVMTHGYNRSIENYFPEAAAFSRGGYAVLLFDGTGVGISDGEGLIGLPQHALDMKSVLDHVMLDEKLNRMPLLLYGHSWGGYASNVVSCLGNYPVRGIISASAFNDPFAITQPTLHRRFGAFAGAVSLPLKAILNHEFSDINKYTSADGLAKTHCPVLLLHSHDDVIVNFDESFGKISKVLAGRDGFIAIPLDGRHHNIVTPPESDARQRELNKKREEQGYLSDEEQKELWDLQSEKDGEMLNQFVSFYDKCLA